MRQKILLSVLAAIVFLLGLEVAARLVYFQRHGTHPFALADAIEALRKKRQQGVLARRIAEVQELKTSLRGAEEALYGDLGAALLKEFAAEYEAEFASLAAAVDSIGSRLVVLYVPSRTASGQPTAPERFCRPFYRRLCETRGIPFLDLTDRLSQYPIEDVTLLPENGHLSRYGNQIVAREAGVFLSGISNHCPAAAGRAGGLYGDLAPNSSSLWNMDPSMPYFVAVNREGFRMTADLADPKQRTRVLCLGDSFTFGPYLPNPATYPALLARSYPQWEVINAGICGYTITDEVSLFKERACLVAPDITLLQVLDNDIMGLFSFKKNEYDRKQARYKPSPLEQEFTERLKALNRRDAPGDRLLPHRDD